MRKPTTASAAEGATALGDEDVQSESGGQDGTGAPGATGGNAISAAMKAKKRRVGGVNIFPGMRKVKYDSFAIPGCTYDLTISSLRSF